MNDKVQQFESFMDMYRAFNKGDTFHDQLLTIHGPVEIKEDSGKRVNTECLACQVIWPCHTYNILTAWIYNEIRSEPITKVRYHTTESTSVNYMIKDATTDEPLTKEKLEELMNQAKAEDNIILPTVPEPMNKRRPGWGKRPFGQHLFERSLFYPGSPFCNKCNLPRENEIHTKIQESAGPDETPTPGDAHWFVNDGNGTCKRCGLPLKNIRHIEPQDEPETEDNDED